MIAQPNQHYPPDVLRDLLDEALSRDQTERVEQHLSGCEACRSQLASIAGQEHWWNETVEVLSESTLNVKAKHDAPSSTGAASPFDSSIEWIRPLLEPCPEDSTALGRLDGYLVQDVIGQGGMGVVLRGIDPELNRPVAIKVLSPHLAGVGAARARFMREAQAAAAIVHPSIVPIYSVVTSARLPYIVMPCIQGGNLQQRIDKEGPLDIDEVLRIGVQVSEGLAAAHRNGVIHRDIKPANILIEEGNGRVLISDFGLARALDDATLTISGMIAGTPQYMSPEQARGEPIDARSDLYSLGSLLFALATGRPPFRADSPLAVLRKISETRPRRIHHINERIPPWFDSLVTKLMTTQRDSRIGSAEQAASLLREAHAHTRNPAQHPLPKSIRSTSNHRMAMVCAAVTAAVLLAASYVIWLQSGAIIDNEERSVAAEQEKTIPSNPASKTPSDMTNEWFGSDVNIELVEISKLMDELDASMKDVVDLAKDPTNDD